MGEEKIKRTGQNTNPRVFKKGVSMRVRGKDRKPRKKGSGSNPNSHRIGWKQTEEAKRKISLHCGRPCTPERKQKIGNANRGEKSGLWKGENVGYEGIHYWLKINFGKADRCEMIDCPYPTAKSFEWALIKGKKYERKRENYFRLCRSCHKSYDKIVNNICKMRKKS